MDRDYDPETGLMLYAGPEQMNLPGDWDEVDPEQGRISLRVNCNTEGFAAKLGAEESVPVILELRMTATDAVTRSVLLRMNATARNSICGNTHPPEELAAEYYSAAQIEARLNTKSDAGHLHEEYVDSQALHDAFRYVMTPPDHSAAQFCEFEQQYVAPSNGWVFWSADIDETRCLPTVWINDVELFPYNTRAVDDAWGMFPIAEGNRWEIRLNSALPRWIRFVPCM